MQKRTRILLVDDHELVRRGLRALLEMQPGYEICGEAADGREALELAQELRPDIVIMDLALPELNGLEATRRILQQVRNTEVLILSMHDSEHYVRETVAAGARGYVLKSDAGRDLVAAVEALRVHQPFFTLRFAREVHEQLTGLRRRPFRKGPGMLTAREVEVVQLLAEGKTNKQVGESLGISTKTAETHRSRLLRKLHISSTAELVRYAIRNSYITV